LDYFRKAPAQSHFGAGASGTQLPERLSTPLSRLSFR
jgi:hypothetical protein